MAEQKSITQNYATPYKFTGKELDEETGLYYFGARYYAPRESIWLSVDPLAEKFPGVSPYTFCLNNPLIYVDPDGRTPYPVLDKFKSWTWRIDSWYGPRNVRDQPRASKFHKGLDFNYTGGGSTDFGAKVIATHDGTVHIDNDTKGGEGRMVTVTSPDGKFRTQYMHLSDITVQEGDKINEFNQVGNIGGSGFGKENGQPVHLHYQIQKLNEETGKFEQFNPTEGKGNSKDNVVDPQKWITKTKNTTTIEFKPNFSDKSEVKVDFNLPKIKFDFTKYKLD